MAAAAAGAFNAATAAARSFPYTAQRNIATGTAAIASADPLGAPRWGPSSRGAPWGPQFESRRFAARTRRMREEQQQRLRQQQQQQPAVYTAHTPYPYEQQQQHHPSLGTQLLYAVASGAGVFLGFTLLARLFGWGPRIKAIHVDAQGRPVDPLTGAPL